MATLNGKPYPSAWICRKCGTDISDDKVAIFLKLCPKCDGNLPTVDPQAAWSALKDSRRANGIDPVNNTELREDGWHNEVTGAVDTMQDQLRYEGEPR